MKHPHIAQGSLVRFRINDVCVPEPAELLAKLHGDELLSGRVTDFSDSGTLKQAFAVVDVAERVLSVVVPTDRLKSIE